MKKLLALAVLASLFVTPALADFTGKDAAAATITFKNPGTCTAVVCVPVFQLYDGTNVVSLTTAGADGVSNTLNGLPTYARMLQFNGTTWDRWQGAIKAAANAFAAGSLAIGAGVDGWNITEGVTTDAASTAGGTGSMSAKLRLMTTQLGTINTTLGTPMQQTGGSVTANAGTNLNTSALATSATQGTTADVPCTLPASATTCSEIAIQKAIANAANNAVQLGSASGGISTKTLATLSNAAIAVKASAGQVYSGQCSNSDATHWAYIQIFNVAAASVTMGTTPPTKFVGIPPASNAGFAYSLVGLQYSTAISAGAASTSTGGTAPTTALDCTVDFN